MIFIFLTIAFSTFTLAYGVLFAWFRRGWTRLTPTHLDAPEGVHHPFSIIVAARNEAQNIGDLLHTLSEQKYSKKNFEVVVINDSSEDKTEDILKTFGRANHSVNFSYHNLASIKKYGKKAALTLAIEKSNFPNIISIDADCLAPPNLLKAYNSKLSKKPYNFIAGPVAYFKESNFFKRCIDIEFKGLVSIGGASICNQSPNLCNGANLMFKKSAFYEVNGYEDNMHLASGDDEFLLHKMVTLGVEKIGFLKSPLAIVYTKGAENFKAFIHQRKRWVSKSRFYSNKKITLLLSLVYLYYLLILFGFGCSFITLHYLWLALGVLLVKTLIEYWYLSSLRFFAFKNLFAHLLAAQVFYIFYVLGIGALGNWGSFDWKGRTNTSWK